MPLPQDDAPGFTTEAPLDVEQLQDPQALHLCSSGADRASGMILNNNLSEDQDLHPKMKKTKLPRVPRPKVWSGGQA